MRLITILFFLITTRVNGTTYFFSTTDGDDSRTSVQAQSSATPWKTIAKLNSFYSSLVPGDFVSFKRGDAFYGNIIINKAGASGLPITLTAYGTGAFPIIEGLTTLSSWTNIGGSLWQTTVPSGLSSLNMVLLDGSFQPMSKLPKGNSGYYTVSSVGTNSITGSIMGVPNMNDGEVCWRAFHWVLWRGKIVSQTSTTVSYTPFTSTTGGSLEPPQVNYGFFFQNAINACTLFGEWAYNGTTHVLTMNFGSDNPAGHIVRASNIQNIITNTGTPNFTTINALQIQGANNNLINLAGVSNITLSANNLYFGGVMGVFGSSVCNNWTVINNNIDHCNSIGLLMSTSANSWTVTGNTISNCGSFAGMGGSGEGQYEGVRGIRNGSRFSNNIVYNIGYIPLLFQGTSDTITNNFIHDYCYVKDDGGGIYTDVDDLSGSVVSGNIILNGIGAHIGTPDLDNRAHGIYVDDAAHNVEISGNTSVSNGGSGIFCHNCHETNIHDNTLYDNGLSGLGYYNDGNTIANVQIKKNISFAKTSAELVHRSSGGSNSAATFFSYSDSNYWCRPINESASFQTVVPGAIYDLAAWKTFTGKDAHSHVTFRTIADIAKLRFEYNATAFTVGVSLNGNFYIDATTGSPLSGTLSLAPFTSRIMILDSTGNLPPVVNAGSDITFPLPATSTTLTGTATDPDGSIASTSWYQVSGPNTATIGTPSSLSTLVSGLILGTYAFRLSATDNLGATSTDDVIVTVRSPIINIPVQFKFFNYSFIPSGDSLHWSVNGTPKNFDVYYSSDSATWYMIAMTNANNLFIAFPSARYCVQRILGICVQKKTFITPTHYFYKIKSTDLSGNIVYSSAIRT